LPPRVNPISIGLPDTTPLKLTSMFLSVNLHLSVSTRGSSCPAIWTCTIGLCAGQTQADTRNCLATWSKLGINLTAKTLKVNLRNSTSGPTHAPTHGGDSVSGSKISLSTTLKRLKSTCRLLMMPPLVLGLRARQLPWREKNLFRIHKVRDSDLPRALTKLSGGTDLYT
jgi:hypothetical protein